MNGAPEGQLDFTARLQRIRENTAADRQLLFVGVDEVYAMPRATRRSLQAQKHSLVGRLAGPMTCALALVIGALAFGLGEVARFHLKDLLPLEGLAIRLGLGFAISLVAGLVLMRATPGRLACLALGVALGFVGLRDVVQQFPEGFATVTSDLWVAATLAQGRADSLTDLALVAP